MGSAMPGSPEGPPESSLIQPVMFAFMAASFHFGLIPLLMLREWKLVFLSPLGYMIGSWLGHFWQHIAVRPLAIITFAFMSMSFLNLPFATLSVAPGEMLIIPAMLLSLAIAIGCYVNDYSLGCSAPAAYSASISYVSGNLLWFGYVFMALVLVILPVIMIMNVDRLSRNRSDKKLARRLWVADWLIRIGFLFSAFTGVFPWLAKNTECRDREKMTLPVLGDIHLPSCTGVADDIHMGGFLSGILFSVVGACLRLKTCYDPDKSTDEDTTLTMEKLRALFSSRENFTKGIQKFGGYDYQLKFTVNLILTLCFLALLVFVDFGVAFAASPERSIWTLCTGYFDKAGCEGANVPQTEFNFINSSAAPWESARQDGKPGWPCQWNGSAPLENINAQRCTDPNCSHGTLRGNAASIACEYTLICSWIYIVSLSVVASEVLEAKGSQNPDQKDNGSGAKADDDAVPFLETGNSSNKSS